MFLGGPAVSFFSLLAWLPELLHDAGVGTVAAG